MAFYSLLKNYNFEVVEFALASKGDVSGSVFAKRMIINPQISALSVHNFENMPSIVHIALYAK